MQNSFYPQVSVFSKWRSDVTFSWGLFYAAAYPRLSVYINIKTQIYIEICDCSCGSLSVKHATRGQRKAVLFIQLMVYSRFELLTKFKMSNSNQASAWTIHDLFVGLLPSEPPSGDP